MILYFISIKRLVIYTENEIFVKTRLKYPLHRSTTYQIVTEIQKLRGQKSCHFIGDKHADMEEKLLAECSGLPAENFGPLKNSKIGKNLAYFGLIFAKLG